jgi:uncharacterized protein (TIGR03067 family)
MTRLRLMAMALALLVGGWTLADDKKPAEKLDPAKLLGDWTVTEGKKAGDASGEDVKKAVLTVTKDKMTFAGDGMKFVFAYKIDKDKSPAEVDLEILEPEAFKSKAKGIIKLEDGKMTLCYHPMGGDRPAKFESTKDNGNYMFVHKKKEEKKEEKK